MPVCTNINNGWGIFMDITMSYGKSTIIEKNLLVCKIHFSAWLLSCLISFFFFFRSFSIFFPLSSPLSSPPRPPFSPSFLLFLFIILYSFFSNILKSNKLLEFTFPLLTRHLHVSGKNDSCPSPARVRARHVICACVHFNETWVLGDAATQLVHPVIQALSQSTRRLQGKWAAGVRRSALG